MKFPARQVGFVVVLAFCIRLAAIAIYGFDRLQFDDTEDYLDAARMICTDHDYPGRGHAVPFFRPPFLPIFIAATSGCGPFQLGFIKGSLAFVDSLTVGSIALFAFLLFGRRAAIAAAIAAAVYPPFVFQNFQIQTESLFMFLQFAALLLVVYAQKERVGVAALGVAGVMTALSALTRPIALLYPVCFSLWLLFDPRLTIKKRLLRVTTLVACFVLTLSPWVAFNYSKYHELIWVNDGGGNGLWRGASDRMRAIYYEATKEDFAQKAAEFEVWAAEKTKVIERDGASPMERDRLWFSLAIQEIRKAPFEYVKFSLYKAFVFWRPWLNTASVTLTQAILSGVMLTGLYVASIRGGIALYGSHKRLLAGILLYLVWGWLSYVPFQVVARFRVPLVDPVLIGLAAGCFVVRGKYARS